MLHVKENFLLEIDLQVKRQTQGRYDEQRFISIPVQQRQQRPDGHGLHASTATG